jgi:hypothetical protein
MWSLIRENTVSTFWESLTFFLNLLEARRAYGGKDTLMHVGVGKPEEKGPLGRPRCKWGDNIKMDL